MQGIMWLLGHEWVRHGAALAAVLFVVIAAPGAWQALAGLVAVALVGLLVFLRLEHEAQEREVAVSRVRTADAATSAS